MIRLATPLRLAPLAAAALLAAAPAEAQLTLRLRAPTTPSDAAVHVAGTFNGWNPSNPDYRMTRLGDGSYTLTLHEEVRGPVEFKFALGSWDRAEADAAGAEVPNRAFTVPASGRATYEGTVPRWRDGSPPPARPSTARPTVTVLSDSFRIPQLGRTRRVWIYLPPDYATSQKRYPVLYMHDGQNLFDQATGYAGEWGLDETLDSLHAGGDPGVIVIAVDHGADRRLDEYSPWRNPRYGGGEGDAYVDFLVQTLKPHIDRSYRTQPGRLSTGIGGSSMGGLISLYAILKYPEVFGRAAVFSPALWFSPSIYAFARAARPVRPDPRIYFVTGGREGNEPEVYVRGQRSMIDTLEAAGFRVGVDVDSVIRPEGTHSEGFWRREFPAAYRWLFGADRSGAGRAAPAAPPQAAPLATGWQSGAVCYEVFVRSFADSNGDGVGDLNGLIQRLDYINDGDPASERDLGASCIWLMPVAESPSYHGYDVADYYRVDREYGTDEDFKRLVAEAHRRGIRVLVDMVLNHASSEHPYFQEALRDTASPYRSWFRFSPTVLGKGPWGADAWHRSPVRDEYYYGVFWRGMPDLNYDSPGARREAMQVATYWLTEMGVDGFRLDAVPYLVEEGDRLSGTAGTHAFLREYGEHVRRVRPGAYTVGEVWDSVGAMLPYYPGELDAYFAFEVGDSVLHAVRTGSARRLLDASLRLQWNLPAARWGSFLRNHDQTRTMTALRGDTAKARVAAAILLTLPGLPYIYYGEEIGMTGDKPDERIRTPMQWSPTTGLGFTTGTPWQAPPEDWRRVTVQAQDADPGSLLNLHRRLIHLRARNAALAEGELVPLTASSGQVGAYLRRAGAQVVMVLVNLGATPVAGVTLSAADGALPAGRFTPTSLVGGPGAAPLSVGPSGALSGYAPAPTLAPHEVRILELIPTR